MDARTIDNLEFTSAETRTLLARWRDMLNPASTCNPVAGAKSTISLDSPETKGKSSKNGFK